MTRILGGRNLPRTVLLAVAAAFVMEGPLAVEPDDAVMRAMRDELTRSMKQLQLEDLPRPYFIAYRIDETRTLDTSARFGSLVSTSLDHWRRLFVEVRVGDYAFDNTNFMAAPTFGGSGMVDFYGNSTSLPLKDDYQEIRRKLWLATDQAYKNALENLSKKKAALQTKTLAEEIPDFSKQEPATVRDDRGVARIDRKKTEALVRELSTRFRAMPEVFTSAVELRSSTQRSRYVNSENSSYDRTTPLVRLTVRASTQAPDGLPIADFVQAYGRSAEELPPAEELAAAVEEMGNRLAALRGAPLLETYNGPVLFEGQAAAELFAQVFSYQLLVSRDPIMEDQRMAGFMGMTGGGGKTEDKLGARVLPRFVRVTDEPARDEYEDRTMLGGYAVDDEGVPSASTLLVERGLLKGLLAGRTPVAGVSASTGNYRSERVMPSNLIVSSDRGMGADELRQELVALVEEREAEFGILVRRMKNPKLESREEQMMSMILTSSFGGGEQEQRSPLIEVYKVYPDGREELVRNVEISGLAVGTFREIVAVSDSPTVYTAPYPVDSPNRMSAFAFGGPSGFAEPIVSWVVPSLLFEEVTLRKPSGEIPKPPVAPHPYFEERSGSGP